METTTENSLLVDVVTAEEVPYVTNKSMDNTIQQVDTFSRTNLIRYFHFIIFFLKIDLSSIELPNNIMEK